MKITRALAGKDADWLVPIVVGLVALTSGIAMGGGSSEELWELTVGLLIPLVSTFLGAHLAFRYAKADRKRAELDHLMASHNIVQVEISSTENMLSAIKGFRTKLEKEEHPELSMAYMALDGLRAPSFEIASLAPLVQVDGGKSLLALRALEANANLLLAHLRLRNEQVSNVLHPLVEAFEKTHPEGAGYEEAIIALGAHRHKKIKELYVAISGNIEQVEKNIEIAQTALRDAGFKAMVKLARQSLTGD